MQLSSSKQAVLQHFNLQELALLISEALAVESEHLDAIVSPDLCAANPVSSPHFDRPISTLNRLDPSVLYQLSCEFGNLAFKYGETLKQVHPETTIDLPAIF